MHQDPCRIDRHTKSNTCLRELSCPLNTPIQHPSIPPTALSSSRIPLPITTSTTTTTTTASPATALSLSAPPVATITSFVGVAKSLGPSRPWTKAYSPLTSSSRVNLMASDSKTADYAIELDDRSHNDNFGPSSSASSIHSKSPVLSATAADMSSTAPTSLSNNPMLSVFSYCFSSILMTVTNKYVLSGTNFNMNFVLLCVQSVVCVVAIQTCKSMGLITYRDFNTDEARRWAPITILLIGMIYTASKALQFLSIPVYTIFKNLTIILIAYGEVLWFGGSVTPLALLSFGLMVVSSMIAAWGDIQHALNSFHGDATSGEAGDKISTLNAGYMWMMLNCFCSAAYVLGMRKRIKLTNFKDFDTMFYNNLLSVPILVACSLLVENWSSENLQLNFPPETRNRVFIIMAVSGVSTVFISYTSAWCVRVTSSTTYSMVGALNKLPIAVSGLIFFDAPVTIPSVSAIFIGFVSGLVYALAKVWQPKPGAPGASGKGNILPTSASVQSMRDSLKS